MAPAERLAIQRILDSGVAAVYSGGIPAFEGPAAKEMPDRLLGSSLGGADAVGNVFVRTVG